MKLADLPAESIRRAIEIYLEIAYGPGEVAKRMPKLPELSGCTAESLLPPRLALFSHEPPKRVEPFVPGLPPEKQKALPLERLVDQYLLQLGNPRFPLMKLVLGEHLLMGEYFLQVDTHEWMFDPDPDNADEVRSFAELQEYNLELKQRIEARWNEQGLPTLLDLAHHLSQSQQCAVRPTGKRILVVDDDRIAAQTLAAFLGSRGYEVELQHDGQAGFDAADAARHHLIVLDCDMPKLSGLQVCDLLRRDPSRSSIPVLLSSLRPLGSRPPPGAVAFLIKPFQADVLLYFVEALVR